MTSTSALRSTCHSTTRRSLMPLLRAVRTKSAFSTSSTAARVVRASSAIGPTPSATAGRMRWREAAVAVAEARQPLQLQREQVHQHQAEPELRQRQAGDRADHRRGVDQAAGPERGEEAQRHADRDGEGHGGEHQLERRPHPLADQLGHRLAGAERGAEIARRGVERRTWRSARRAGSSSPISLRMRSITAGSMVVRPSSRHARDEAARAGR